MTSGLWRTSEAGRPSLRETKKPASSRTLSWWQKQPGGQGRQQPLQPATGHRRRLRMTSGLWGTSEAGRRMPRRPSHGWGRRLQARRWQLQGSRGRRRQGHQQARHRCQQHQGPPRNRRGRRLQQALGQSRPGSPRPSWPLHRHGLSGLPRTSSSSAPRRRLFGSQLLSAQLPWLPWQPDGRQPLQPATGHHQHHRRGRHHRHRWLPRKQAKCRRRQGQQRQRQLAHRLCPHLLGRRRRCSRRWRQLSRWSCQEVCRLGGRGGTSCHRRQHGRACCHLGGGWSRWRPRRCRFTSGRAHDRQHPSPPPPH